MLISASGERGELVCCTSGVVLADPGFKDVGEEDDGIDDGVIVVDVEVEVMATVLGFDHGIGPSDVEIQFWKSPDIPFIVCSLETGTADEMFVIVVVFVVVVIRGILATGGK